MSEIRVTSVVGENGGDRVGLTTGLTVGPLTGTTGIGATITHQGHAQFAGVCTATSFVSNGHTLPGADNTSDLGSSSKRWRNIYSADLQLSNVGTGGNEVDGTEGKWTLQEAEDTVYMINRITGKRYKVKMEEV